MTNPPYIEFYQQFKRNFKGPLEGNTTFADDAAMQAFLTNGTRYAGQIVTCEEFDGQVFVLNNAEDAWINVTGTPISPSDFGNLRSDGTVPMDSGVVEISSPILNIVNWAILDPYVIVSGDNTIIYNNGDSIQIADTEGANWYRLVDYSILFNATYTMIVYQGNIIINPATIAKVVAIPDDYTPVRELDIATKRYVDETTHLKLHYMDDPLAHGPAGPNDYGKIVASNPITGAIEFIEPVSTELTSDVTAEVAAGNIDIADTLPIGLSFQGFVERLLLTTYNPTFITPTFSLSHNQVSAFESGSIINVLLTANFNRGAIRLSQLVGGIWTENYFVDYRAGAIIKYTINGVDTNVTNTGLVENFQIIDGSNAFLGSIQHAIGPQPLNSEGVNYDVPYPAATVSVSTTIQGKRKTFYGSNSVLPTTSSIIRALSGNSLGLVNGSTFTITIGIGDLNAVFAYPNNLRPVTSVIYVEGMNVPITDLFTETEVTVAGALSYIGTAYRVYTYTPVNPFSQAVTFIVTI